VSPLRFSALLTAAVLLGAGAGPGAARTADRGGVVSGLQAWLDGTATLEARFRQTLLSGALGTTVSETGRLYLERPGKLRWDYLEPERKVALLLGDRTFLYLEDDRQFVRGRLAADQSLFPRLLAGGERLEAIFSATLVATPSSGGRGAYRLRLTPKTAPGGLAELTLTLRAGSFAIDGAEVLDEGGNRMTYVLSSVGRNGPLPEGTFSFEPPPGTEVVDQP
jgi:outer membrane lipoprotein carrier protein